MHFNFEHTDRHSRRQERERDERQMQPVSKDCGTRVSWKSCISARLHFFFPASTKLAHHCAEWSRVPVEAGCLNSGMRVQGCGIIQIIIRAPASRKLLTPAVYDTVSWVVYSHDILWPRTRDHVQAGKQAKHSALSLTLHELQAHSRGRFSGWSSWSRCRVVC